MIKNYRQLKVLDPILSFYEYVRISRFHNSNVEPVLIYQMGKVGSSTIYNTLNKINIQNSLYHVHSLRKKVITDAIQRNKKHENVRLPLHYKTSLFLIEKINLRRDKIKVITLTREPVGRIISRFFQNLPFTFPGLILPGNKIDYPVLQDELIKFFLQIDITKEDATTWFDREFKEALGIDMYSFPFNKEQGYQIFSAENIECLVIKLERLEAVGCEALNTFFAMDIFDKLRNANIGSKKGYASDYQAMKGEIRLDIDLLNKLYSTKYMNFFYTQEEISNFIKKWSI